MSSYIDQDAAQTRSISSPIINTHNAKLPGIFSRACDLIITPAHVMPYTPFTSIGCDRLCSCIMWLIVAHISDGAIELLQFIFVLSHSLSSCLRIQQDLSITGKHDAGAAPLPGELGASLRSNPESPRVQSPVSEKGPVGPMFHTGGHSGSVGMPVAPGYSNNNNTYMPGNSNSLRSPTALEAASQEAIAQSRYENGGLSGGNSADVYYGRGGPMETPMSPAMFSTVGSRGGLVRALFCLSPALFYSLRCLFL